MFNTDIELGAGHVVRAAAITTNSYVAGNVVSMGNQNTLGLEVDFTLGSLTSMEIKIEVSNDAGTTYAQQVSESTTGAETTVTLHNYTFEVTGIYSLQIRPASMVLPNPTSSATRNR